MFPDYSSSVLLSFISDCDFNILICYVNLKSLPFIMCIKKNYSYFKMFC